MVGVTERLVPAAYAGLLVDSAGDGHGMAVPGTSAFQAVAEIVCRILSEVRDVLKR